VKWTNVQAPADASGKFVDARNFFLGGSGKFVDARPSSRIADRKSVDTCPGSPRGSRRGLDVPPTSPGGPGRTLDDRPHSRRRRSEKSSERPHSCQSRSAFRDTTAGVSLQTAEAIRIGGPTPADAARRTGARFLLTNGHDIYYYYKISGIRHSDEGRPEGCPGETRTKRRQSGRDASSGVSSTCNC
jgi:hypothetical protein